MSSFSPRLIEQPFLKITFTLVLGNIKAVEHLHSCCEITLLEHLRMGAIAAAFNKRGFDAPSLVLAMLEELEHRGTRPPTVVGQPSTFVAESLEALRDKKAFSKVAVGSNSSDLILGENYTFVVEGRFFPPADPNVHQVMHETARQPLKNASRILRELEGSYTFTIAFTDRVLVGRDAFGTKPLYYGEDESVCAIASERKALWKIGIADTYSFPPGNLASISECGFVFEPVAALKQPIAEEVKMADAARRLERLLEQSTGKRVSDVKKIGVAFSGGLDSSVIAFLAKLAGVHVHLICVGLEGQRELESAKDAAETLELPLTQQTYSIGDVENVLPKVLWLIEEPDVMKAGVAIPFYWTAEVAAKLGFHVLLAGQGADELFGGYHRYLRECATGGDEKVREALFHDTAMSYETNFQRDEPVCTFHKVDLRLPFVDAEVMRFALSLPVNLNFESPDDKLRKRVLRQAAKNLGISASIADKPKRAVQFATGVDKALERLASEEDLTRRSYVDKVFRNVYPRLEVGNE